MGKIFGHVKWFDATKGYGFLVSEEGHGDILLHSNILKNFGRSSIAEGVRIQFECQETDRGLQVTVVHQIESTLTAANDEPEECNQNAEKIEGSTLIPARVKWFDKSKGFGFANSFNSTEDIFLHMDVLRKGGFADLQAGEAIAIKLFRGPRGKMAAAIFSWDCCPKPEDQ